MTVLDAQMAENLGPLAALAGTWEGDAGVDVAMSGNGPQETRYRERLTLEPLGPARNTGQVLYGLRYHTTAWPLGQDEPFHEEVGYWLWDAAAGLVMRCFIVPRGVSVSAGGTVAADATEFELTAEAGAPSFGVLSNPVLEQKARTERYVVTVTRMNDDAFCYREDTQLRFHGTGALFHHTDENTLSRVV